jgi:phosphatidylserine/phosphatidylglycerophosphate/cardiolipin synthase-like enzyme
MNGSLFRDAGICESLRNRDFSENTRQGRISRCPDASRYSAHLAPRVINRYLTEEICQNTGGSGFTAIRSPCIPMRPIITRFLPLLAATLVAGSTAFSQTSLTTVAIPNAIADGGGAGTTGSPYAVFVRIQNWTAGANGQAYLKLYSSTGGNEYMWNGTAWNNSTTYSVSCPQVPIDASGNWSGWIYAKHNTGLGATASVRAARVVATGTNLTSASKTFTVLNMTPAGNGGWLVRTSSPAANKGILAYAGGAVVGSYRTEDNTLTEGYSFGAGGFKIAVPAGVIDSLVALNDDGTRFLAFPGPWVVSAGQETDASATAGAIGHGIVHAAPGVIQGTGTHSLTLTVLGESPYVISHARIFLPTHWNWSHAPGDVAVTGGGSPIVTLAGDTIAVSGLAITGTDSARITITNVVAPDTTASFVIGVHTGTRADSIYALGAPPSVYVYGVPTPIAVVKTNDANGVPLLNGRLVTVRGVVTVSNQLGVTSFVQDNTGGIAVYGSSAFSNGVAVGDEVVVSGVIQPFAGLCEIFNPVYFAIANPGNPTDPVLVTTADVQHDGASGIEQFEGRLVRINNVTVLGTGTWNAGADYVVVDATDSARIYVNSSSSLVGSPIPAGSCDIVGVVSQHVTSSPYIGGYEILPRGPGDILSAGPVIATVPVETRMTPNGLNLVWTTVIPGTSRVRYGTTPAFELGIAGSDTIHSTSHDVPLSGLLPATMYHVQAFSVAGSDTSTGGDMIVSTASPATATGAINVYFNKSVYASFPPFVPPANGSQNLVARLLTRINAARVSIDAAFYSLSGTPGPGTDLAQALIAARSRGVSVRVICDSINSAPLRSLVTANVPLIPDSYDPVNAGAGLMHNKFVVIDGRGGASDSVWVWTGSWNPTDPGTNADYQNAIEIQDPALAGAYVAEFNEMWGSGTDAPNQSLSRFGARKTDNTPHRFIIGGHPVSCYFSPSDHATSQIVGAVNTAQGSICFSLLTLTRSDIANALLARRNAGVRVLGAMDAGDDQGSQYSYLTGQGVDIRLKSGSGLLHHKYAVLSADFGANWDRVNHPTVITGSHNWTNAAENSNNENTLIIEDDSVALAYLQEFTARYYQFGGTGTITVGVDRVVSGVPETMELQQNYPNPFNGMTEIGITVRGTVSGAQHVRVKVFDILGREVSTLIDGPMAPGVYRLRFDAPSLASGVYLYTMQVRPSDSVLGRDSRDGAAGFTDTKKMVLIR